MGRPPKRLNDRSIEVVHENHLKETPEGFREPQVPGGKSGVVIADHIPEIRKVMFLNGRDPGRELMFHYHSGTHPLKHYTLFHGKEYDLPVEIIEHLEQCAENQYGYRPGMSGHPEMYVKSKKYLYSLKNVKKAA